MLIPTIREIISYITGVKRYKVLLDSNSVSPYNPVINVLDNTIGNIVWTRSSDGVFLGTLAGAFAADKKTFCQTPSVDYALTVGGEFHAKLSRLDENSVILYVFQADGATPADTFTNLGIDITVYTPFFVSV